MGILLLNTLFVLWITNTIECSEKTQIPQHLLECYSLLAPPLLPMNIETMTEIIRKINSNHYGPLSLAQEISDILNWFSVEGLERSPNTARTSHVLPYHRTGFQAYKQNLLFEKFISIQRRTFQAHSLSRSEKCTLHSMMSPSIEYWERGDESKTCPTSHPQFRNMTADGSGGAGMYSVCPVERGVVLTPGGSVSMSRVLTALLAALTPQQVPLSQLTSHEQLATLGLLPSDTVSNIWAATLAGDLAEVAVEQNPMYEMDVKVGIPGHWNDTDVPSQLYFDNVQFKTIENHQWQITDAEILGGMDGILLGNVIQKLRSSMSNMEILRLSQILEMYYSTWSVTQEHVCKRKSWFYDFFRREKKTLIEQTKKFAALLSKKTTKYFTDSSIMAYRCINAVERFAVYYSHLAVDVSCPTLRVTVPRLNLFVILDATWPPYPSLRFLMQLTQKTDISYYGGRITVINGGSSSIAVNSTSNPSILYQKMTYGNQNGIVSDIHILLFCELRLYESLNALKNMLEVENIKQQAFPYPRKAFQDVVVVSAYASTIGDSDLKNSLDILKSMKSQNPAVQYIYITSPLNRDRFRQLAIVGRGSADTVISTDDAEAGNIVSLLQPKLRPERLLKPAYCNNDQHQWPEVWYNEYVTPGQTNGYWIHPDYFHRSLDIVKITFKNYQYGELKVCMSRDEQRGDCKIVGSDTEVTHGVLRPCDTTDNGQCLPLYFTVTVLRSYSKCAEHDCRFPIQVKFSIIVQDLHCIKLNTDVCSGASLSLSNNMCCDRRIMFLVLLTLIHHVLSSLPSR